MDRFKDAIKALHARKDEAYGAAWKRRGERISVLPNIARKVDRLEVFASKGLALEDESVLDTTIDLFVYLTKYRLFLADQDKSLASRFLPKGAPTPYSDEHRNFDYLIDVSDFSDAGANDVNATIGQIFDGFEKLWPAAEDGTSAERRMQLADEIATLTGQLLGKLVQHDHEAVAKFMREEIGS